MKKLFLLFLLLIPFSTFGYSSNSSSSIGYNIPANGYLDIYFAGTGSNIYLSPWSALPPAIGKYFYIKNISYSLLSGTGTAGFELWDGSSFSVNRLYSGISSSDFVIRNFIKIHNNDFLNPITVNVNGFFFNSGSILDNNGIVYNTSSGSTSIFEFSSNGISINKDFYYTEFNILLIYFFVFLFSWKVILFVIKKM